jgi:hypothetical protein
MVQVLIKATYTLTHKQEAWSLTKHSLQLHFGIYIFSASNSLCTREQAYYRVPKHTSFTASTRNLVCFPLAVQLTSFHITISKRQLQACKQASHLQIFLAT